MDEPVILVLPPDAVGHRWSVARAAALLGCRRVESLDWSAGDPLVPRSLHVSPRLLRTPPRCGVRLVRYDDARRVLHAARVLMGEAPPLVRQPEAALSPAKAAWLSDFEALFPPPSRLAQRAAPMGRGVAPRLPGRQGGRSESGLAWLAMADERDGRTRLGRPDDS